MVNLDIRSYAACGWQCVLGLKGSKLIDIVALMQLAFSLRPLRSLRLNIRVDYGCLSSSRATLSTRSTCSTRLESVWGREVDVSGRCAEMGAYPPRRSRAANRWQGCKSAVRVRQPT